MPKIRVLVVDDAVVIRRMLTEVLTSDPDIEVVGTAANGRIGIAKLTQVNPDVVILDVEMPELNGLETVAEIRKTHPRLPIIMFSALTERGATTTLDALSLGASDYATKPSNVGSVLLAQQRVREELIPKIKALCGWRTQPPARAMPRAARTAASTTARPTIDVVAIGVSTGGPNALAELLPVLPADFAVPIVIVQHMPPVFTKLLADRLAVKCRIQVVEGATGMMLRPGHAYIAPGDYHMALERVAAGVMLKMHKDPPENSCRPAVDVLFRACAGVYRAHVLAAVLTGMGQDGFRGCEVIHEVGGQILAQDEASSVVWGMPSFVVNAGLANRTLPLNQIGPEIIRRVAAAPPTRPLAAAAGL
jgi:two-component system chemotaxis response regulator CheB